MFACCKHLPVMIPQSIVVNMGVLVFSLTLDKKLNKRPSLDIAYKNRGIGNRHPNKLNTTQKYSDKTKVKL